jgi:uncharacterized protein YndB with AHSA1/START domain
MSEYRTTILSNRPPGEVFDYLADFSNAAEWDPGITEATDVTGEPIGPGSRFHLVAMFLGRSVHLEYEITTYEPPRRVVLEADEERLHAVDMMDVLPEANGSRITYRAELTAKGAVGRLLDPALGLAFRRIGDRGAEGLRQVLNRDTTNRDGAGR